MTDLLYRNDYEWQGADPQQLLDWIDGYWVDSGASPSLGTDDFDVDVASGTVTVNGTEHSVSSGTGSHSQASSKRKDYGIINTSGNIEVVEGSEEAAAPALSDSTVSDNPFRTQRPAPPDHGSFDGTIIYEVWIDPNASHIGSELPTKSDALRDRRLPVPVTEIDAADLEGGDGTAGQMLRTDGTSAAWSSDPPDHGSQHHDGGADEIDAANLAGGLGTAGQMLRTDGAAVAWSSDPPNHASQHQDGGADELEVDNLAGANGTDGQVLLSDGAAANWEDGSNIASDPWNFSRGGVTYDDTGGSWTEIGRLQLQTGETLVVERIESRQIGGGSSTSFDFRIRDSTAASTIGSQTLGGTTKDPGSSGSGNLILVEYKSSVGSTTDADLTAEGWIDGA